MTRIPKKASRLIAVWLLCLMLCLCTALGWRALTAFAVEEASAGQPVYLAEDGAAQDPAVQDAGVNDPATDPGAVVDGQPAQGTPADGGEGGDAASGDGGLAPQEPPVDEPTAESQATTSAEPTTPAEDRAAAEQSQVPTTHDITLDAETSFAWYDNGTIDGEPDPSDPYSVRATTRVSATLPAGTVIAGVDADTDLSGLTLKARLYGAYDSDVAYAYYRDLLDQHVAWHASLLEPAFVDEVAADPAAVTTDEANAEVQVDPTSSEAEVSTSPSTTLGSVQIWRVWLEDATGAELDVILPVWSRAQVAVDYLMADDGSLTYPTAPTGEAPVICTGAADLETLNASEASALRATFTTVPDPDPLDATVEEGSSFNPGDTFGRIAFTIKANEGGASAWGDICALYTMEPVQPQQPSASDETASDVDELPGADATGQDGLASGEVVGALGTESAVGDADASSEGVSVSASDDAAGEFASKGDASAGQAGHEDASADGSDGVEAGAEATQTEIPEGILVSEPQTLTAYDNGTTTGQLTAEGMAPSARVDVTLPAGTTITGAAEGADLAGLTLRVQLYDGDEEGFDLAWYQSLVDQHMAWHAESAAEAGETSQADVADVQYWRVWLEDATGAVVGVSLPAGEKAAVTVEYLPGADGSYAGALSGDVPVVCTGAIDLGKLGAASQNADPAIASSSLEATFETLGLAAAGDAEADDAALEAAVDGEGAEGAASTYALRAAARVVEAPAAADEGDDLGEGASDGFASDAAADVDAPSIARVTYYLTSNTDGTSAWDDVVALVSTKATPQPQPSDQGDQPGVPMVAGLEEVPDEVLQKLAAEQGIYPGTSDENGVWTVYDTGDPSTAAVKATVTLPAGAEPEQGYYLYIRKVGETDPYHPNSDALAAAVGATNDAQCYAIHWVHIYQDENDNWTYAVNTTSVLGEDVNASVQIEYLKSDAYLVGHQAERKLMVYNSRTPDGTTLEEAGTPTGVSANDTAYTGFTFTTNRGGPYVFVSKKLFEGYVSSITVDKITDGVAPFDSDNEPGNDTGDSNLVIRSYDAIQYALTVNFAARSSVSTTTNAEMGFEMTLSADVTEAVFDTGQMLWMGTDYTIEYLDEAGGVVLTQDADGKYHDANGAETTLNAIVSGSAQGPDSYTTTIVSQRLRGKISLSANDNILSSNKSFSAAVQVLGADNGSTIQPTFKAWFVGNEDNYGSESVGEGTGVQLAQKVTDNEKTADAVTVSAAARFNLELAKNSNVSYKGWFDSSTGKEINSSNTTSYTVGDASVTGAQLYALLEHLAALEENAGRSNPEEFTDSGNACSAYLNGLGLGDYTSVFKNIRYGRITGYGITLQVYNEAADDQNAASKGFRGISLPQGDIDFNLALDSSIEVSVGEPDPSQYYARLWEYNENVTAPTGKQGHNLYWAGLASTQYASWAAPYNSGANTSGCYDGGAWQLGEDGSYHFTVCDYDFNFLPSGLSFPTHRAGNGTATTGYDSYIGCFSAGFVQVLNVMPRYQTGTLNMNTVVTVRDLSVSTTDGQSISTVEGDSTGYAHETNTKDNVLTDNIPLYARGGMTKANAFDTAALFDAGTNAGFSSKDYFLGTDFWGTSYDCSAFAGQDITLVGAARINAGDYQIKHMNMLQLFDSEALSIVTDKGEPYVISRVAGASVGQTTILYAADPDYPTGYDTNVEGVMAYMSTVREEDLIYFRSLDDLRAADYTCVGVMAELRNASIVGEGGYSTELRIPMKVSDNEKFLGKTVGTVNAVRIWTNALDMENGTVSWANGTYDESTGKNSVAGYTPVDYNSADHYSGQVANGTPYDKTKYSNGQVVLGSNTGGYVYGSSLLILGYKSEVDIEVDNGGTGSLPTFDLDHGQYTVNYRLKDIVAKTDDTIGKAQDTQTNLTVLSKLDTARKDGGTDQRISISSGSYAMHPASDQMVLTDARGNPLGEQEVEVSSDPRYPTTVSYAFIDPKTGEVDASKVYTIQVYAQRDVNGNQVTFELSNVTVGVSVPNITYDALIDSSAVKDSDRIEASAYISGTSDVRAYSTTNGNMDSTTIGIIQLKATQLIKAVDEHYIEQDGVFTYTVTYTNAGNEAVDVYLYDLLPDIDDIRGSAYEGEAILRAVSASLSGEDEFTANIQFYYSKTAYTQLYDLVRVFGDMDGTGRSTENIERMLSNTVWFQPLGTISSASNHQFVTSDNLKALTDEELTDEMREMTGIYAVVKNLSAGKSLTLSFTIESDDNAAGNVYRNLANSWLGGPDEPLQSNLVETSVLGRAINGVVWEDANLNGVRDEGESLIPDVTCTLFVWDDAKSRYVECTEDVTGAKIEPITTDSSGAYSFDKLPAGKYIVAFSGDALEPYAGATVYQVTGGDGATNNDAVALTKTGTSADTEVAGISGINGASYKYAIAYDLTGEGDSKVANPTTLHTIEDILSGNITLTNSVELYANLDCGLVRAGYYELPETGGSGTRDYAIAGAALMAGVIGGLALIRRRDARLDVW